jgi:hypothetical protein
MRTSPKDTKGALSYRVPRKLKALLILIATLMLPACAASPPAPGNNKAGVLRWFAANAQAVQAESDRHCKPYGKAARITEMRTAAGECVVRVLVSSLGGPRAFERQGIRLAIDRFYGFLRVIRAGLGSAPGSGFLQGGNRRLGRPRWLGLGFFSFGVGEVERWWQPSPWLSELASSAACR